MSPRFSVIVPVFNVSSYLRECLDSILAQTEADFELLAVNDGSSDGSGKILDEYATKDKRIIVIHTKNQGVSSSRNTGIDNAKGDFICFVDGDDVIEVSYLKTLFEALGNADSALGGYTTFGLPNKSGRVVVPDRNSTMPLEENLKDFFSVEQYLGQRYLWNRMFRASVIKEHHLRFDERIHYKEDGLFVVQYLCRSNGIVGISNSIVYHYRRTPTGAMGKAICGFNRLLLTDLLAHIYIIEELKRRRVSHLFIDCAVAEAKSVYKWLFCLLRKKNEINLYPYYKLECLLCRVLGVRHYIAWHLKHLTQVIR